MTARELLASVVPPAESWPAVGAFLGAAVGHRLSRWQIRRMLRPLERRLARLEYFLETHFKLPPLGPPRAP